MSDTPEPLSAILAERRADEIETEDGVVRLDAYADRIEAAVGRERNRQYEPKCNWSIKDALALANTLANHGLRDGNADAASSCIYSLCRILSAPGNAAAMRRALESVEGNIAEDEPGRFWLQDPEAILHEVQAALAAPARNCDRTKDEAEELFKERFGRPWTQTEDELSAWLFSQSEGVAE